MSKTAAVGLITVVGLAWAVVVAPPAQGGKARSYTGRGHWQVEAARPHGPPAEKRLPAGAWHTKRWRATVQRAADDSISGQITMTVGGTAVVENGTLSGRVAGARVWGEVFDEGGTQVATFEGRLTSEGLQGQFTMSSDEMGTWRWQGPLPE